MKYLKLLFIFFLLFSCSTKHDSIEVERGKSEIKYAKNLEIHHKGKDLLIHILNPENQQIEKRYFIQKNKKSVIPAEYILLNQPIQSIIALSSTQIGMLQKLKSTSLVVGISNHLYVYDPIILKKYNDGKVIEMGEESSIPVESIISSKAQILMYSGFGKSFPHEEQLEKFGVNCLMNYDWKEVHPLGKAEWIKLFGFLVGKEKEANLYFKKIEKEYHKLKRIALKAKTKPTIFSGNLVGDIWFSPAGKSYNAILFKDAQSEYVYKNSNGTGSVEKSFEQTLIDNKNTDFWFNPGVITKKELLEFQPKFVHFKAVETNKVYSYSYSGNEFWERSCIEPHHVLSDLIQILHPELRIKKKYYFYRKLN